MNPSERDAQIGHHNTRDEKASDFALSRLGQGLSGGTGMWQSRFDTCRQHGQYRSIEKPGGWTGCPECNGEVEDEAGGQLNAPHRLAAKVERPKAQVDSAMKTATFIRERLAATKAGMESPWATRKLLCERHGPYESFETQDGWGGCPDCEREESLARLRKEGEEKTMSRFAEKAQKVLGTVDRIIPSRFRDATFDSYHPKTDTQKEALEYASRFAQRVSHCPIGVPNLFLHGSTGVGKTHLGFAIVAELANHSRSVYRQTVLGLMERLKSSYSPTTSENHGELIWALSNVDVLILDEVGTSIQNRHEAVILRQVIDARHENELPTVILSNLHPEKMPDAIGGEPAISRLTAEAGEVCILGEDGRIA